MSEKKPADSQSDPLLANKIIGSILAVLLLIVGLPQLGAALFSDGHHGGHGEIELAYCCVELDFGSSGGAAAEEEVYDLGALMAEATVAAGERGAALCASCHTFEKGGANATGPNLWNIVGRDIASVDGFNYTSALKAVEGDWTYEKLDKFIANSQDYVPGTAMAQRIGRDSKRAELLVYLGSLSENPVPAPQPLADAEGETSEAETAAEDEASQADAASNGGGDAG